MLRKLSTLLLVLTVLATAAFAQDMKSVQSQKVAITGAELGNGIIGSSTVAKSVKFEPVVTSELTFNFVNTSLFTGYDLQSNGTPQHIWQDPNDPNLVYMVFTTSAEASGWTDRNGTYLFSDDMGTNWQNLGKIQTGTTARGGFVTISGLSDGRPIAALHTNDEGTATITHVYVRDAAGSAWTNYNNGSPADGDPIWPRVLGVGTDRVVLTSSINGAPNADFFTNTLNLTTGTFTGWNSIIGTQAETQNIALAADGTIGLAYIGNDADSATWGDIYYRESNDNGVTWSDPVLVHNMNWADTVGGMRGVDIAFLGNDPYITFEVLKQSETGYFGSYPNAIYLWSPAINGGVAKILADSNNVEFFDNYEGANDVFAPVCRPSIGKTSGDEALFITFNGVTEDTIMAAPPSENAVNFFAGYFMYSTDGGNTFTAPEKFTPVTPRRDWRYANLNPINHVDENGMAHVLMAVQSDEIPGSTVNGGPNGFPTGVTAELVFVSTEVQVPTGVNDPGNTVVNYNLEQNYPNPFNPNTNINFSLQSPGNVSLKVYDVLGNEVATLLNGTMQSGNHSVSFDGSNLSSGMYLYTLKAGSFTSTKKMILMK